jgi:hypothetical protein
VPSQKKKFHTEIAKITKNWGFIFRPFDPNFYHGDPKIFGLASCAFREVRTSRAVAKEEISHGDHKDHKELRVLNFDHSIPTSTTVTLRFSASPHARSRR